MTETEPTSLSGLTAEVADNPPLRALAERADRWVRETLGRWAGSKVIRWRTPAADSGAVLELYILDQTDTETIRFTRTEIQNERLVKRTVNDAWGRLIDRAIQTQVEGIRRLGEELRREVAVGREN